LKFYNFAQEVKKKTHKEQTLHFFPTRYNSQRVWPCLPCFSFFPRNFFLWNSNTRFNEWFSQIFYRHGAAAL